MKSKYLGHSLAADFELCCGRIEQVGEFPIRSVFDADFADSIEDVLPVCLTESRLKKLPKRLS